MIQGSLFTLLFIIFLSSAHVQCYYTKYEITEFTTSDATFLIELESWTAYSLISPTIKYSDCGAYLIAGYNILGPGAQKNMYHQRIYDNLPPHNMIYLTFIAYVIDSVDSNDYFQVKIGSDITLDSWQNGVYATKTEYLCGQTGRRDIPNIQVFITAAHSDSSLTLKFISQCDQVSSDEAFGFRQIRLIFAQAPTITASTFCAREPTGYTLVQTDKRCSCAIGQYLVYNTTTCAACDSSCVSCFGPTRQQCYECISGYNFDGIQCVKCHESCATCNGPNSNQCNTCPTGKILYNNKFCVDSSVCSSPLVSTSDAFGNVYCSYKCTDSQYLVWNGDCVDYCDSPLTKVTNATGNYCLLPCAINEFYHEDTETCSTDCKTWVEERSSLYYVCGPTPFSLMRPLHYIKYLDIDMPAPLANVTVSRANNLISLRVSPDMFVKAKAKFVTVILPAAYQKYGVSSSFISNFMDDLILLAVVLISAIIFLLLEVSWQSMEMPGAQLIFERLRVFTGFNLPILLIFINSGDIVFFSSLEFRTFNSDNPNSTISLGVAIVMLVAVVILLIGSAWLNFMAFKIKNPEKYGFIMYYQEFQAKWQGFQILFKGFKGDKWYTQMFFPLYCLRIMLPMIMSAGLWMTPLLQTLFNTTLGGFVMLYLYFVRPMKRRSSFLSVFVFEILLFCANFGSIVLVSLVQTEHQNEFAKIFFAHFILVCNLGFSVLAVLSFFFKLSRAVDIALYYRKNKDPQQRSAWMQIFLIPFQQGGIGFEEVQIDRIAEGDLEETEMINLVPAVRKPPPVNVPVPRDIFSSARKKHIIAEPIQEEDEYVIDDDYQPRKRSDDTSRLPLQHNRTIGLDQTSDRSFGNSRDSAGDSAYGSFPIRRMADKSRIKNVDDDVKLAREVHDDF